MNLIVLGHERRNLDRKMTYDTMAIREIRGGFSLADF